MEENTTVKPKPKKGMLIALGLGGVVVIYLYMKNKSNSLSAPSTAVTGGAIDPLTGQPYQPGVGSLSSTGSGLQGMQGGGNVIIKNIMPSSGGGSNAQNSNPSPSNTVTTPTSNTTSTTATQSNPIDPITGGALGPGLYLPSGNGNQNYTTLQQGLANGAITLHPWGSAGTGRTATGAPAVIGQGQFQQMYPTSGPGSVPLATQEALWNEGNPNSSQYGKIPAGL